MLVDSYWINKGDARFYFAGIVAGFARRVDVWRFCFTILTLRPLKILSRKNHTGCRCARRCSEPKKNSPVRGDIFVEIQPKKISSSVRSGIFHPSIGRCRSYGAYDFQETKSYKYVAPTALIPAC